MSAGEVIALVAVTLLFVAVLAFFVRLIAGDLWND